MSGPRSTRSAYSPSRASCPLLVAVLGLMLLGGAADVAALAYDIMLDASGSMAGFKTEQDATYQARWRGILGALEAGAGDKFQFGNRDNFRAIQASLYEVPLRDDETYLGEAVQRWVGSSAADEALIVITDNQADTQGLSESTHQQQILEQTLTAKGSPFAQVGLFAVRLPFSGPVYSLDGKTKKKYTGERALVIYILGRTKLDIAEFRGLVDIVRAALAGFELRYFPIRPFDSASVSSQVDDIAISQTGDQSVHVTTRNGRLIIDNYPFGEPLKLRFKADIKTTGNALQLQNVALDAALRFDSLPELVHGPGGGAPITHAKVIPEYATFTPDEVKGFDIQFEIHNFGFLDLPFTEQLAWTMRDTQRVEGRLDLRFHATKDQIQVDPDVLTGWNHEGAGADLGKPDAQIQTRVYHLGYLIKSLVPEDLPVQTLKSFPVTLEMRFPASPLLIVLLLLAVLLGLLWALARWLNRDARFVIEDEYSGTQIPIALTLFGRYTHMSGDDRLLFSLRYIGIGSLVATPYVLRSKRLVGPGHSILIYNPETEDEREFRLTRAAHGPALDDVEWE